METLYWVNTDDGLKEVRIDQFLGREYLEFICVNLGDVEHLISTAYAHTKLVYVADGRTLQIRLEGTEGKLLRVYGEWKWAETTLVQSVETRGAIRG